MSTAANRVWRLLGDLEYFLKEQYFSIKQANFEEFNSLEVRKEALIEKLDTACSEANINRSNSPEFNSKMDEIMDLQAKAISLIDQKKNYLLQELDLIKGSQKRVLNLKSSYGSALSESKSQQSFEA